MIDHVFLAPAQDYKILQVMCLLSTRIHVRPKSPAWAHDVTHTHTPHACGYTSDRHEMTMQAHASALDGSNVYKANVHLCR